MDALNHLNYEGVKRSSKSMGIPVISHYSVNWLKRLHDYDISLVSKETKNISC